MSHDIWSQQRRKIEGAWLHYGYLSKQLREHCSEIFLRIPSIARSTRPKCSDSLSKIPLIFEKLARSYIVNRGELAMRLVEETETHVLVGLLLLLLLGSGGLLGGSSTTGGGGTTSSGGSATSTTRGNGSELLRSGGDELVDVLALKLGDQLVEALVIGLDANGAEDRLHFVRTWTELAFRFI